ncbi:MAG: type II 3-dehydroquinate dehydratase [Clostridia bacterium]|nr:type II 3-dehydroquinate dehydratase [Clostridia bacterium]
MKILVINGPNINLLGLREPQVYGKENYEELRKLVDSHALEIGVEVKQYQSNHEGDIVDVIQGAYLDAVDGIIINPAAYTHTSIAILDALKAVKIPCVEVHISDVEKREAYRQISYVREVAIATVSGKGIKGYAIAMDILKEHLSK